jgi:hypothetical protein
MEGDALMAQHPSSPELLAPLEGSVDPELLKLPRPPRLERLVSLGLMVATAVLAAVMVVGLAGDVRYALASTEPDDVGDLIRWIPDGAMSNRFVRGTGKLGSSGAIRYDRPLERDSFRLAPVEGNHKVWVEMRVTGSEPTPFVAPTTFVGRVMPLEAAALRYRGLGHSVHEVTGAVVPEHAWVLVDGATPTASRWTVALAALLVLFAGYNIVTIARIVRPVKG